MESPFPSTPTSYLPVSPAGLLERALALSCPGIAHSTPMQPGGFLHEFMLQLQLKELEMVERRPQLQHEEAERQILPEIERTCFELSVSLCRPPHSVAREDSAEARLARSLKLVPAF